MYTPLEALAIFAGIPLATVIVISLLVLAPGWTRTARRGGATAWSGDPLWIGETAATPAIGSAASDDLGGASARW